MRDVRVACADWGKMRAAALHAASEAPCAGRASTPRTSSETQALLRVDGGPALHVPRLPRIPAARRRQARARWCRCRAPASASCATARRHPHHGHRTLPGDIRRQSRSRELVLVTKANSESTVHRSGYLDYVGIKQFDAGRPGRSASGAFSACGPRRPTTAIRDEIPLLRHKVAKVVAHFALAPDSHDGKALQHILESFPRDELFQASVAELNAHRHRRVRPAGAAARAPAAAARPVPPVLFLPDLRAAREIQHPGAPAHRARDQRGARRRPASSRRCRSPSRTLARIHIVARTPAARRTRIDVAGAGAARRRRGALLGGRIQGGAARRASTRPTRCSCSRAMRRVSRRLPGGLRRRTAAARDVAFLEALRAATRRACTSSCTGREPRRKDRFFLKIFRSQDAIPISDLLPMLENIGAASVIAERPYQLDFPRAGAPGSRTWNSSCRASGRPVRRARRARSRARFARGVDRAAWTATASIA